MAFTPKSKQPEFASLTSTLAQTKNKKDNALYNTLKFLIERLTKFQTLVNGDVVDINQSINSVSSDLDNLADKKRSYVTVNDESLHLPGSRRLIAGENIELDASIDNQLTINALNNGGYIPMVTGAEPIELMSDGAGHLLLVKFEL